VILATALGHLTRSRRRRPRWHDGRGRGRGRRGSRPAPCAPRPARPWAGNPARWRPYAPSHAGGGSWGTPRGAPPSGHTSQRYPADTHGHFEKLDELGSTALTWGGGGPRNCMACKGSDRSALGLTLPLAMASMPRARARATRRWVASFDRPPRAARLRVCPGRSRPAAGR